MSGFLIAVVGFIYLWVGCYEAWNGNWGMAVVFGAYALANVGLIMQLPSL
jgi:hypothetical protein